MLNLSEICKLICKIAFSCDLPSIAPWCYLVNIFCETYYNNIYNKTNAEILMLLLKTSDCLEVFQMFKKLIDTYNKDILYLKN